jgi:hypothetical protein
MLAMLEPKEEAPTTQPSTQPGEITTSIPKEEFEKNLQQLLNNSLEELKKVNKNGEKYILGFHGGQKFDKPNRSKQYTGEFRNENARRIAESMGARYEGQMLFYTNEEGDDLFDYNRAIKEASYYAINYGENNPTVYAYLIPVEEADFTDRGSGEVGLSYDAIEKGNYIEVGRTGYQRFTQPTEASEYINYSGGAIGSDTIWSEIGKEFGIGKQVDYKPQTLQKLTPEQVKEVEDAYQKAASDLGRKALAYDWNNPNAKNAEGKSIYYSGGLVRRDYLQAKAADAVFAVGKILEEGDTNSKGYEVKTLQVDGGTGYAVQMAINLGKPIYVFDLNYNVWMKYNPEGLVDSDIPGQKGRFDQTDTPVLTKKFAGVGTREITEAGKQAIRDVYTNTFNRPAAPEMKRDTPIQPEVSNQIQPEGLPGIPRTSSSCK